VGVSSLATVTGNPKRKRGILLPVPRLRVGLPTIQGSV